MNEKPSYKELEQRVRDLEGKVARNKVSNHLDDTTENLQSLLSSCPAVIYICKPFGDFAATFFSDNVISQIGYSPAEIMNYPDFWISHIHPEDKGRVLSDLSKLFDKGHHIHEYRFLDNNGKYRWMRDELRLVLDETGNPKEIVGSWIDISDRKQMEDELRESKDRFKDISFSIADWIWEIDNNGKYIFASGKVKEILGYSPEQIIGKTPFDFMPPEEVDRVAEIFKGIVAAKKPIVDLENWNLHQNGAKVCLLTNAVPLFDKGGELLGYRGVDNDITKRKAVEEDLKERIRFTDKLIDATALSTWISDENGTCIKVNPSCVKFFGVKKEEVIGKYNVFKDEVAEKQGAMPEIKRAYATGEPVTFFLDYNFNKVSHVDVKGATHKYIKVILTPIVDKNGKVTNVVSQSIDLTDIKQAEEERTTMESQLRQAVKMQAVGTLAGGIAHEFNNLLGVIMGCADMARDEVEKNSFARKQLDRALKASYRAKDLVKQILTFSRQKFNQKPTVSLNLASTVRETLDLIKSSIPSSVDLNLNIAIDLNPIQADTSGLSQIMINLCSNAVWAMKEKGLLTVSLEQIDLKKKDETERLGLKTGQYLKLSVSDTGEGMDTETKERVFEPFFTTKEVGQGTGMGLATVLGIVESYEGTIAVDSESGKGTTFHLYFPTIEGVLVEKEKVSEDDTKGPDLIPTGNERILFIDDKVMYTETGKDILESLGYFVTAKTDSREALEAFQTAPYDFDLVITDQIMPHLSGDELTKEFLEIRPDIPIILCTGYSTQIDENKAKSIGAKEYVLKPIAKKDIAKLIRKVLDG